MARRRYQSDSPVASGPRRAVIYARVSSKEQEREGYSIPAQLKLLREYAAEHGMYVASEYIDVETAKQSGRTGFNEMVGHLRRPTTNRPVVLVEKTDRLYRNLKDWVTLDELDLEIHFVKEGVVLSTDSRSSEKFMHGIKVLMAKNYIDNLSEEVRKGMQEKAEQGVWPSRAPLGYRNVTGQDGKRTIELDPAAAPVIEQMFQWYSTGRYSLRDITLRVQAAGLQFRATGARVPKTTVNQILRNPLYQGDIPWNGRLYRGTHQPLVSREVWATVQDVLAGRPGKHRQTRREFAFAGLITCGHCGCSLTAELKKGRYVYYHCTGFRGKCGEPYVREEVLEHQFTELLGQIRIGRDVLDWATEALRQSHAEAKRLHDEAISRLQDQYAVLQHRIDAMYIDKLDGKIDSLTYDRLSDEWRCEQARVLSAMESHQSSTVTYLDEGARLLELASRCQELFAQQPPIEKRRLLNFVVSNCSWREGVLTPTFRKPFDLLAE
nr:recombinase family protein [Propionibacteriaceae bacterium]